MSHGDRTTLEETTGALQFLLAFYVPGQRYLDTEAWKVACAGAVRAYTRAATELQWTFEPLVARGGEVHRDPAHRGTPVSADQLRHVMQQWLDADDATHFGAFERDLSELLERHHVSG